MTSRIRHRRNATAGAAPAAAALLPGELAVNTRDARLFARINDGADRVVTLGAEMSPLVAGALKETSGAAFLGAMGLPAGGAGFDLIETRAATGAEVAFTGLAGFRDLMLVGVGVQGGASITTQMQVGHPGGYLVTSIYQQANAAVGQFPLSDSGTSARSFSLVIHNFNRTDAIKPVNMGTAIHTYTNWPVCILTPLSLDRLRVFPNTGNLNAGTIYLLGRPG
jgi:hypothetical protein